MNSYTVKEVLQFTSENDVKFVRLAFCDTHGVMKNIAIMAGELPKAFESGVAINTSLINGFESANGSDLYLYPDSSTLSVLPWRPKQGRVVRFFCYVKDANGKIIDYDTRTIIKKAAERAKSMDLACLVGSSCSFYLFELDEYGKTTKIPLDNAGYLDIAPPDKGENIRREICLTLEEMDVIPKHSFHGIGPGQNIIDFKRSDPLTCADNLATFKTVVKSVAARNGLYASLMPVPDCALPVNKMSLHISLFKHGVNLMQGGANGSFTDTAKQFAAGILSKLYELSVFSNPAENSYKKFEKSAVSGISWSSQNRSSSIRMTGENGTGACLELSTADIICNPYITLAMILNAGLDGIESGASLPQEDTFVSSMPQNLGEAIEAAEKSDFIKKYLPESCFDVYCNDRMNHWNEYINCSDTQQLDNKYFELM